jgi:hypothetical protein
MSFPNSQSNPAGAIPIWDAGGNFHNFSTSTAGYQVKLGAGVAMRVTVNTAGTGTTLTLYDGTDNTGGVIATIATTSQISLGLYAQFSVGLFTVATAGSGAANLTITYH